MLFITVLYRFIHKRRRFHENFFRLKNKQLPVMESFSRPRAFIESRSSQIELFSPISVRL